MLAVNYTTMRNNLKDYCDKATNEQETVIVTRKNEKNVVLMSLENYNNMLKAIQNAQYLERLNQSMEQKSKGNIVEKSIEELEANI